ncbi:MAG: hypothetical protein EOP19_02775, partial [Hyphomicrobiales bacterium]
MSGSSAASSTKTAAPTGASSNAASSAAGSIPASCSLPTTTTSDLPTSSHAPDYACLLTSEVDFDGPVLSQRGPPGRFFMSDANPILAEQTRGNFVENRHRGAFVITDADGRIMAAAGDIARPVFPRSAIKSMQALAMLTSGSIEKFGITDEELALACASHTGEDVHVAGVAHFLGHIGLSAADLECGAHQPTNAKARAALREAGLAPSPLHNNCSGKHSGMLSVARALGVPTQDYVTLDHPVQQAVRAAV